MKPSRDELYNLYIVEKTSPENIGKICGASGRTVREWLTSYGIPRLGPAHLRKGKSAHWNVGLVRSEENRNKNRDAHLGKTPHNKGSGDVVFDCVVCGKPVSDKPYRRKLTCSEECKNKYISQTRGENHWNYTGENAGYIQKRRLWAEYRDWRAAVYKRDGFTCVKCGVVGKNLNAHHLDSFSAHPEKRLDVSNGVTLCKECHAQFHRDYGLKFCTSDQFNEWITNPKVQRVSTD